MAIILTDDGTLDTVLRCDDCGEEMRYNYQAGPESEGRALELRAEFMLKHPQATDTQAHAYADEHMYDEFVQGCIEDAESEHQCADEDADEPNEDAITTTDHETFYQYGKMVLQARHTPTGEIWFARKGTAPYCTPFGRFASCEQALKAFMVQAQFWPDVWFISDHGNAHRIDLSKKE